MSNIVFVAPSVDSVTGTTVYGAGHSANITDEAFVARLINDGKAAYQGAGIRGIYVAPIATTTATVNWVVDQACTAMKVNYGTTTALGSTQNATPTSGSGAVVANLTALTTGTLYYYSVSVTVGTYVSNSAPATFRTA